MKKILIFILVAFSFSSYAQKGRFQLGEANGNFIEGCDTTNEKTIFIEQIGNLVIFYDDQGVKMTTTPDYVLGSCGKASSVSPLVKDICYQDTLTGEIYEGSMLIFTENKDVLCTYIRDIYFKDVPSGKPVSSDSCNAEDCKIITQTDSVYESQALLDYGYYGNVMDSIQNVRLDTLIAQNYRLLAIPYDTSQVDTSLANQMPQIEYNDNEHFEIDGAGSLTFAGGTYHSISYVVISGDVNVTVDGTLITDLPTGYNAYFIATGYLENPIVITAQAGDRVIITTVK